MIISRMHSIMLLTQICLVVRSSAFQLPSFQHHDALRSTKNSKQHSNFLLQSKSTGGDDDDMGPESIKDGEDLAKEFFRQQRERERRKVSGLEENASDFVPGNPRQNDDARTSNPIPAPFDTSRGLFDEPSSPAESDIRPKRKFTGRLDDNGSFSPQVMSSRSSSGGAGGRGTDTRSPREVMMQREYELVGRAERNIGFQAILAGLALAFYIYVGATGGIVSGVDAVSDDFGGEDSIYYEEIMPVPRDSETSVFI